MRRALASLKYVPALLCGLLMAAWVVNCFFWFAGSITVPGWNGTAHCMAGCHLARLELKISAAKAAPPWRLATLIEREVPAVRWGSLHFETPLLPSRAGATAPTATVLFCPLPLAFTLLLPLALAPFHRFRFPLWYYFAWTALLALELAFYLR